MEALCMLNLLAERVASSTAPKFVAEIARFVTSSAAVTAAPSAAQQQQQQLSARLGCFSSLVATSSSSSSSSALLAGSNSSPGSLSRSAAARRAAAEGATPLRGAAATPHHHSSAAATVAGASATKQQQQLQIPLAIVVGGVAQDWTASGGGGGRSSLVDAIQTAESSQLSSSASATTNFTASHVVSVPNDAERVGEILMAECTALVHRRNQQQQQQAFLSSSLPTAATTPPPSSRVIAVFQMGDTCQAASEELQSLTTALVELVSCKLRFASHCTFSAVVVVRSPWFASVLLNALSAPPLQGALNPQVFENDSSGESTFPSVLFQVVRHFPFFVMSESAFRAVCISWNAAHRLQDLVHALHAAMIAHLKQFPDLDHPVNRANTTAVRAVLSFAANTSSLAISAAAAASASAASGGNRKNHKAPNSSSSSTSGSNSAMVIVANSFTTLYYELLVKRNIQILAVGGSQQTSKRRQALVETLRPLLVKMAQHRGSVSSVVNVYEARRRQRDEDGSASSPPVPPAAAPEAPTAASAPVVTVNPMMAFPAIPMNSVRAFTVHPSKFDDADSSDVVRLVCVLSKHFRTGVTVERLMEVLGDRRRVLIAVHQAAAAGLVSVRLESGMVRLVL